ncbi:MAG: ThuA domain-containing protein [Allosphingosinicella sp.]
MITMRQLILLIAGLFALAGCATAVAADTQKRVLLFSHSTGYRHASIEPGIEAIRALGAREGIEIVASEDPDVFSAAGLSGYDAIIFLSTSTKKDDPSSEWFQGGRRDALQGFVRNGGGIVGIHAASDSHYHWPWYVKMIGGHFISHPEGTPEGALRVVDRDHPATKGMDATMRRVDEWYYFGDYNPETHLLVTLDPASIGEKDVNPNPVSWAHEYEGGRVFYTAMGHTTETYQDPNFLAHLAGGLKWTMAR